MQKTNSIVIAGAGVFGTALAQRLSWNPKNRITLYSIEPDVVSDINEFNQNSKYFPGRHINTNIKATLDISCSNDADVIFLAIPSQVIETYTHNISPHTPKSTRIVNLSKGLAVNGNFLVDSIPFTHVGSLKGPTFAVEVMNGVPSALTYGGTSDDFSYISSIFLETGISLDYTEDIRGVELLSVLKNMYAIAIGIVSGRYNSPNVDFQIMTKAVNEMRALLELHGCSSSTIFTYCGIGDLGLTALNDLSRNRTLGLLIGKGFFNDPKSSTVTEGLRTIRLLGELVKSKGLEKEFKILNALYALMYSGMSLNDYYLTTLS